MAAQHKKISDIKLLITDELQLDYLKRFIESKHTLVLTDNHIGNAHFVINRGSISLSYQDAILNADCKEVRPDQNRIEKNIPKMIGDKFSPVEFGRTKGNLLYITDGKHYFNAIYYYIFHYMFGCDIHGDEPDKPFALVKDGIIIGCAMGLNPSIADS